MCSDPTAHVVASQATCTSRDWGCSKRKKRLCDDHAYLHGEAYFCSGNSNDPGNRTRCLRFVVEHANADDVQRGLGFDRDHSVNGRARNHRNGIHEPGDADGITRSRQRDDSDG